MRKMALVAAALLAAVSVFGQGRKEVSVLEVIDAVTGERRVVKEFPYNIQAPNWTPDGKWLVYNSGGKIFKISPDNPGEPILVNTGFATRCNNDHCLSFDGKMLGVSSSYQDDRKSRVCTLPLDGGEPKLITETGPSYLHGWSPDGRTLAYCAERNGNYDVYTISANGGKEKRLTSAEGLDDGPEYTPDGKEIWFNSVRSGLMQIWKMKSNGKGQMQMTFHEDRNAWFPHVSPDGKTVSYITYRKGDLEPGKHVANKEVELWVMPTEGGEPRRVAELFGGQGTINVNSWAPDSRHFAFVSYRVSETFGRFQDIGNCALAGSTVYNAKDNTYTMTASGDNMWGKADAIQYAYHKMSGDFTMSATMAFEGEGMINHRKMGIVVRESLDPNAACVYIAIHGSGLAALQSRKKAGDITESIIVHEDIKDPTKRNHTPYKVELVRKGDTFYMRTLQGDLPFEPQAEVTVKLPETCYVGLYVCAHTNKLTETIHISNLISSGKIIPVKKTEKISLFDGKTLKGWTPMPRVYAGDRFADLSPEEMTKAVIDWYSKTPAGAEKIKNTGNWQVVDGAIEGGHEPVDSRIGSYLVSDEVYGDFELELDVRPDWPADTGIMLRANQIASLGLQVLLDYRPHGGIAGVYGNSLGGFLASGFFINGDRTENFGVENLRTDSEARTATVIPPDYSCKFEDFKKVWNTEGWNHFKIRCVGDVPVITTWVNGLKVCEINMAKIKDVKGYSPEILLKRLGTKGHIAFEVHDVPEKSPLGRDRWEVGAKCRWKNITIMPL